MQPGAWGARAILALGLALGANVAAAQTIHSISDTSLPRAGRLIIYGDTFGDTQDQGSVTIGSADAPVSFWSDTKIRAYVPEDAPIALDAVQVHTSSGSSNTVSLDVTHRPGPDGRVRWRFTADDDFIMTRPAVGHDGTVYVTGMNAHLYALTPDGGLRWLMQGVAGDRSPSVGPDGTIYVTGAGGSVSAIDPNGTVRWSWSGVGTVFVGPTVGPDGNIYGVTSLVDGSETGAFVLSPNGQLLFNDAGGYNVRGVSLAWEVAFSDHQWFITSGMGYPTVGVLGLFAYDMSGGGLNWDRTGLGQTFGITGGGVCVNDPAGNRIVCYHADGSVDWEVSLNTLGGTPTPPGVASDGTYYFPTGSPAHFHAVDPGGTIRWTRSFEWTRFPVVRPDDGLVIASRSPGNPNPVELNAYDPSDGEVVWSVPLRSYEPLWYGEFSADGRSYYFGVADGGYPDDSSHVYAIDASYDTASWSNYGSGWPGTFGVPALTSRDDPVLGSDVTVDIENSLGSTTRGFLFLGFDSASIATRLGGTLLVDSTWTWPLTIPGAGLSLTDTLPNDPALSGTSIYLQTLEIDSGASHGVSFTAGLELRLGY